jgi:hypothetical protein
MVCIRRLTLFVMKFGLRINSIILARISLTKESCCRVLLLIWCVTKHDFVQIKIKVSILQIELILLLFKPYLSNWYQRRWLVRTLVFGLSTNSLSDIAILFNWVCYPVFRMHWLFDWFTTRRHFITVSTNRCSHFWISLNYEFCFNINRKNIYRWNHA